MRGGERPRGAVIAIHLVGGGSKPVRRHRDRGDRHEEHVEDSRKELYADEYLPRDAEAGGVLLDDENHVAEQEQYGHRDPDCGIHDRRLGIRLHVGPVRAVADVGAVALVEACSQTGCRGDRRVQG